MDVVLVPVRHHSPACARLVKDLVARLRPSRVLIEGPSDFEALAELLLPHALPIAIYSFVRMPGLRSGAYYPFCEYSPEWQAIRCAGAAGIPFEFIDLPWSATIAIDPEGTTRYADGSMRRSRLIDALCAELCVDDFDAVWDTLFEIPKDPDPDVLLERLTLFCGALRTADEEASCVRESDLLRESYMRRRIRAARAEAGNGPVLVVTGGYHTPVLLRDDLPDLEAPSLVGAETGIALTPYDFARLDAHTGYASGMPSPGFYQALFHGVEPMPLAMQALRARKQLVSTADLITAEALARGLAALRGHERVFRVDVLDGARAALVKDAIDADSHPVLAALLEAFRGGDRGRLAPGTRRPPLAREIDETLRAEELWPSPLATTLTLALRRPRDRIRSRLLHRAVVLSLRGFRLVGGTDFATRKDLEEPTEQWELRWVPELEGDIVEAASYGGTWVEAVETRLMERAIAADRDAGRAARICLDAALCGIDAIAKPLVAQLVDVLRREGDFARLAEAMGHLLYLYRFDEALGAAGGAAYVDLLVEAYERAVWVLATLGDGSKYVLEGVARVLETRRRCADRLPLAPLEDVLRVVAHDPARAPSLRGAAAGGLLSLGTVTTSTVVDLVQAFARPEQLGDFLTGLFSTARESLRHDAALMLRLDEVILAFPEDDFLAALPALRLAFSFFPPRERHHLVRMLLDAHGDRSGPLPSLVVDAMTAARTLSFEARLLAEVERHGIRSLPPIPTGEP